MCLKTVPVVPTVLSRMIVVGNVMGHMGVVTWNGFDTYQKDGNIEGNFTQCLIRTNLTKI